MDFVCTDIHGMYDRYMKAVEEVGTGETLHVLGDIIDRGEDGIKILQDMMTRPNIIPYIGNHEMMMLDSISERKKRIKEPGLSPMPHTRIWMDDANGGYKTAEDYAALPESEQDKIEKYLRNAYVQNLLKINGRKYLLCHSCYIKGEPIKTIRYAYSQYALGRPNHEKLFYAVWHSPFRNDDMREPMHTYTDHPDITFIIGHVPVQQDGDVEAYITRNIVNIDCGCAFGHVKAESGDSVTSLALLNLGIFGDFPTRAIRYLD